MIKRDIEWHKGTLRSMELFIQQEEKIINKQIATLQNTKEQYNLLKKQIETAEKEGKKSFDSEKYLIKRKGGDGLK